MVSGNKKSEPKGYSLDDLHLWMLIYIPGDVDDRVTDPFAVDVVDMASPLTDIYRCTAIGSSVVMNRPPLNEIGGWGYCVKQVPWTSIGVIYDLIIDPLNDHRVSNERENQISVSKLLSTLGNIHRTIRDSAYHLKHSGGDINAFNPAPKKFDANLMMKFDENVKTYNPFAHQVPNFAARFGIGKKLKRVEGKLTLLNHYNSDQNMVCSFFMSFYR